MSTRVFKICQVSENTNEFGLRGVRVMSPDGVFFEIALNDLNLKRLQSHPQGQFTVPCNEGISFETIGAEIPEYQGRAPFKVVKEIYPDLSEAGYNADSLRFCEKSPTKWHKALPESVAPADGADWTVDVFCDYCGRSGAIALDPDEIDW